MLNDILKSQGSQYHDESPTGTNEYLYLWAALNKFGRANCSDWTGKEVFLKDVDASYNRHKEKVMGWNRHNIWQALQTLKRKYPELSWQDILKDKCRLSEEDKQAIDFLKLVKIVEDWERFDVAKRDLQSAFGDGRLKAYLLADKSGDAFRLKEEFWKTENTWEVFENAEEDFNRGYKKHSISQSSLIRNAYPWEEESGKICIKKDDLEKFLSGNKEESPQPPSSDMNAETIIKFLKTKGYVNPHFKLMLHYVCRGITESSQRRDFENWVKNNGNSLVPELSQNQIDSLKDNRFDEMFRQIRK